jgi:hypothetical protein
MRRRVRPVAFPLAVQVALSVFFTQDLKRGYPLGMVQEDRPHRFMERELNSGHERHSTIVAANVEFQTDPLPKTGKNRKESASLCTLTNGHMRQEP